VNVNDHLHSKTLHSGEHEREERLLKEGCVAINIEHIDLGLRDLVLETGVIIKLRSFADPMPTPRDNCLITPHHFAVIFSEDGDYL
jgi:hypothetical protein